VPRPRRSGAGGERPAAEAKPAIPARQPARSTPAADDPVIAVPVARLDAMIDSRRIAYQGSGPLLGTLVQALEDAGVAVTARRNGPYVGRHREDRGMGDAVDATLVVTGATASIETAVSIFRQQFSKHARVTIEDEEPRPHTHGRHRA